MFPSSPDAPAPSPLPHLRHQVREAQLAQYNYILVIGAEEVAARSVNVRTRDNVVHGAVPLEEFAGKLDEERRSRGAVRAALYFSRALRSCATVACLIQPQVSSRPPACPASEQWGVLLVLQSACFLPHRCRPPGVYTPSL